MVSRCTVDLMAVRHREEGEIERLKSIHVEKINWGSERLTHDSTASTVTDHTGTKVGKTYWTVCLSGQGRLPYSNVGPVL